MTVPNSWGLTLDGLRALPMIRRVYWLLALVIAGCIR